MSGRHSISIAVLTKNQDDVALINSTLRDAGHAAHCHWVSSPSKLADTLAAETVELLILNCDSYTESIRQVVKQKDRYNPEVPVIALQKKAEEQLKAINDAYRNLQTYEPAAAADSQRDVGRPRPGRRMGERVLTPKKRFNPTERLPLVMAIVAVLVAILLVLTAL